MNSEIIKDLSQNADSESSQKIKTLNDKARSELFVPDAFKTVRCKAVITAGLNNTFGAGIAEIVNKVQLFDLFNEDNDPNDEHDYGSFNCGGKLICFKFDYLTECLEYASPDPADNGVTVRVLTMMLAEDY